MDNTSCISHGKTRETNKSFKMEIRQTDFPGLFIVKPKLYKDNRGYFIEKFNAGYFNKAGIQVHFVQDNQSQSGRNVLRGLHYQLAPYAQAKLIHVLEGEILDVAVDLRKNSPTFSRWFGMKLNAMDHTQLFIPRGFAHGFSVLSQQAVIEYKCDNLYRPEAERGIIYNDPSLNIEWQMKHGQAIISPKDQVLPGFAEAEMNFVFGEQ
jgi:dTDP-4-dehydrorhamnose 3,5-epimerase